MKEMRCPVCDSDEEYYDGDECSYCMFLACPICSKVVHDYGDIGEVNPCEHVVAWQVFDGYINWENHVYEQKYNDMSNEDEENEMDLEDFANECNLNYVAHSDEAGHGATRIVYFLFLNS